MIYFIWEWLLFIDLVLLETSVTNKQRCSSVRNGSYTTGRDTTILGNSDANRWK